MPDNPFKKNDKPAAPATAEEKGPASILDAEDVCPFMTNNALQFMEPPPELRFSAKQPVGPIPILASNYNYCIEKACKVWDAKAKDCSIKVGMAALSEMRDLFKKNEAGA